MMWIAASALVVGALSFALMRAQDEAARLRAWQRALTKPCEQCNQPVTLSCGCAILTMHMRENT